MLNNLIERKKKDKNNNKKNNKRKMLKINNNYFQKMLNYINFKNYNLLILINLMLNYKK